MTAIAIIPARGGSKRIPRKNIKEFLGKPIIAYPIEAALGSGLFDEVMVSTDDDEIEQIAVRHGAKVPFKRSSENSDDHATTADVLVEVLANYQKHNRKFDLACCIYPTTPLLTSELLKRGVDLLTSRSLSSVFPVVPYGYPIWRSLKIISGDRVEMIWPENLNKRSQDLPQAWHDAGQFYWFSVTAFLDQPLLFGPNSGVIRLTEDQVQDIDNEIDWQMAELKAKLVRQ